MADIDIDPFGEHESGPEEPTDENILLTPVGGGGSTREPTREQETSFGGRESQRTNLMKAYVKDLYKKLSENIGEAPELVHFDYFKLEGGELYYIGNRKPLTTEGKLKSGGMLVDILGKNRLHRLDFNIPVGRIKHSAGCNVKQSHRRATFKLSTRPYDKRDDFDFHIVNFPYLSSNIPSGPSYGVYISQLIRYARCCSHYDDFRYHHKCLVDRLLSQGYIALRLEKSFKKSYGRYQDLIEKYQRSVNVMVNDSFPG